MSVLLRVVVVLLAGVALGLSWQPYGLWPLLIVGIPAFTLAVRGVRPAAAFGLGYLFGLTMLTLAVSWVHVLGTWIAAVLIIFMALFFGLLGLTLTLVGRLRWWPLATACCWVLIEYAYSRIPFGGFGWTRIAYAAVDTPLAGFFPIIGVAGVSFVVALIGQLIAWARPHAVVGPARQADAREPTFSSPAQLARQSRPAWLSPAALPGRARGRPSRKRASRDRAGQHPGPRH